MTRAALCFFCFLSCAPALALREDPTWTIQTGVGPDAAAGGWFINLGITGARGKIEQASPRELEVTFIFADTPAEGRLEPGDRIVSANGRAFPAHRFGYGMEVFGYQGPMQALGDALESCQATDGVLRLGVLRAGAALAVEIPVGTRYGAFSASYPFSCARTDMILAETCAWLAERQDADGHWLRGRPHIDVFAALALLASGQQRYAEHVERAARAFAQATDDQIAYDGLDCWKYTLYGTYLAEYYLASREPWVLAELEEINRWLLLAQMENGGWGHRPAHRPGGNGYGAFCAMTAQAQLAWSLMLRCGIDVDRERYVAAHDFLLRGSNDIGYVWYADDSAHPTNYADMGRTGTSALAHQLAPEDLAGWRETAQLQARCIGAHPETFPDTHGSPLLGLAFTALGAAADPSAFRRLFDANRWHFNLAQCPDGSFYYQPNRDNNPQDYAEAPRLAATATTALVLAISRRSLEITRFARPLDTTPLQIYILAGQSNMEGPADNATLPELAPELLAPRDDVWCVYARHVPGPLAPGFGFRRGNFGPELRFGQVVGDSLASPVLLFKSATGGKTLHFDFRPPSAVARAGGVVGPYYDAMLRRLHNLLENLQSVYPDYHGQGYQLAGFLWLQGESDCLAYEEGRDDDPEAGCWLSYEQNLRDLIADVRADTGVPDLPVVIVQINDSPVWDSRGGGPVVRQAQRRVAEQTPHVRWVRSDDLDEGYHYDSASHLRIGQRMAEAALQQRRTGADEREAIARAGQRFRTRSRPLVDVDPALAAGLREGLHSYWKFDEAVGARTADTWRHVEVDFGQVARPPEFCPGMQGSALRFEAGAELVVPGWRLPVDEQGNLAAFSVSCWLQKTSKLSGNFVARHCASAGWSFGEAFGEGWPITRLFSATGVFEEQGGWDSLLSTGDGIDWHHVVVVFDAATQRLEQYVDGQQVAHPRAKDPQSGQRMRSLPASWQLRPADPEIPLRIGSFGHGGGARQALDELAIWSRALSRAEVEALYRGGHGQEIPLR